MTLSVPEPSVVILIGPSGAGKSTFARKHFRLSEVLSSDHCRFLVCDDENNQAATNDAFDVLHHILRKRLSAAKLSVIDATNVQKEGRSRLLALAREYDILPVAIVLNLPECTCRDRNAQRPDRNFAPGVLETQCQDLRCSIDGLQAEGFSQVYILDSPDCINAAVIERRPLGDGPAG